MDLTLLIFIVIAGFLLYSLINTIRSLTQEIKEIKNNCVIGRKDIKFSVKTGDPLESFNTEIIDNIKYFQKFFDDKKI